MGAFFQPFLEKPLRPHLGKTLTLLEKSELDLLPQRHGDLWKSCEHTSIKPDSPTTLIMDGHVWLDPLKAKVLAHLIAKSLAERDPDWAFLYKKNLSLGEGRLNRLHQKLENMVAFLEHKSFFVLHDTYQYLEKRYGLQAKGVLFLSPDMPLSGKKLRRLAGAIRRAQKRCSPRRGRFIYF